jgi:hypothetical protein
MTINNPMAMAPPTAAATSIGVRESPDVHGHQGEDSNQIEHPLHHDRGEGCRKRQPLLFRQEIRSKQIADPCRQDR